MNKEPSTKEGDEPSTFPHHCESGDLDGALAHVAMASPPPPLSKNDSTAHAKSIPQTQPNVDNSVLKHVTSGKLLNHVSCRSSVFDSDVSVLVLFSLQYYLLLE